MAVRRLVSAVAQLTVLCLTMVGSQFQQFAPGASVNYFQQPAPVATQMMVMQIQQTTTVTYIASPLSSPLAQFVLNNPQGLAFASQRANQRMQDLALQAFNLKRIGLDSLGAENTCGQHTIFIGTKKAAMALMEDKTLVDFLLEEIFLAMGLNRDQYQFALRDIVVYNKQGAPNPNIPISTTMLPSTTTTPAPVNARDSQLSCQNSATLQCDARARFRSADGRCNNLRHNLWGASLIPHRRFLAPAYQDGISAPRSLGKNGFSLASPRDISNLLHHSGPAAQMTSLTHMVMQWGQFIDHDLSSTPVQTAQDGSALTCCEDEAPRNARVQIDFNNRTSCFPIPISPFDPFFRGRTCFSFSRSVQVTNANCQQEPVEQLNQLTAYIDASMVYGNTDEEARELRTFSGGKLLASGAGGHLLPKNKKETCVLHNPSQDYCFKAGDIRVNEQMALASMHTVWLRQHNRLTDQLAQLNPQWDDERLYQETRKIIGALIQQITYSEWLPIVLDQGRRLRNNLQLLPRGRQGSVYDQEDDASIRNAFTTAALRFGHSLIRDSMSQMTQNYMDAGQVKLESLFGNTSQLISSQGLGVDMYMRGLVRDPPNVVDRYFTAEVRNHLFQDKTGNSLDLIAFNIQRGRDHGLAPYNAFRSYCGLRPVTSFQDMPDHEPGVGQAFSQVYQHPDDIDLFSGAMAELREGSGLVGPTVGCLLSEQFRHVKLGDRFWYETSDPNTGFTSEQLEEIRKHNLARVLCDCTAVSNIQPDPFRQISIGNPLTQCEDIDEINLAFWKEGGGRQFQPQWGTWGTWSDCFQGSQMRSRSCSQGGSQGSCFGDSREVKQCADRYWTSQWGDWSSWSNCFQGVSRRTRLCQGLSGPCLGSPEDSFECNDQGTSTMNLARPGGPGWSEWGPWDNACIRGKQWRTRACSSNAMCIGPGSTSRNCNGNGNGNRNGNGNGRGNGNGNGNSNGRGPPTVRKYSYDACYFFNLPEYC